MCFPPGLREITSPNTITFIGFAVFLIPFVLSYLVYGWDFESEEPPGAWFSYLIAGTLFFYSTFDNSDGKQARKTGNASTLGMLFDHGCDCLVTGALCVITSHIFSFECKIAGIFTVVNCFSFFLKIIEQSATGKFELGVINPIDEGIPGAVIIFVISGMSNNLLWKNSSIVPGITWQTFFLITMVSLTIIFSITSISNSVKGKGGFWVFSTMLNFLILSLSCFSVMASGLPEAWKSPKYLFLLFVVLQARLTTGMMVTHVQGAEPNRFSFYPMLFSFLLFAISLFSFLLPEKNEILGTSYKIICLTSALCILIRLCCLYGLSVPELRETSEGEDLYRKRAFSEKGLRILTYFCFDFQNNLVFVL